MSGVWVSPSEESSSGELRSTFSSTTGGVMTVEAGALTGDLDLFTRLTPDGTGIEAMVRYAKAIDRYTISGSPIRGISGHPDQAEHRAAHERILVTLTTPGDSVDGNERATSLGNGAAES